MDLEEKKKQIIDCKMKLMECLYKCEKYRIIAQDDEEYSESNWDHWYARELSREKSTMKGELNMLLREKRAIKNPHMYA